MARPFTYDEYVQIIESFKNAGYEFLSFPEALVYSNKIAVLRHDIDLCLDSAFQMALLENRLGVTSTYCVLLTSPAYNVWSRRARVCIEEILKGHRLGLHFDPQAYPTGRDLTEMLESEADALERLFGIKIEVVSHHCYHKLPVGFKLKHKLIDTYEEPWMSHVKYFADSYGAWRFGQPLDSEEFKSGKPVHLNMHPFWWSDEPSKSKLLDLLSVIKQRDKELKWWIAANILGF